MAYLIRGDLYAESGQFKEAIEDFTHYMEKNEPFSQGMSAENLLQHNQQKSEILAARGNCLVYLFLETSKSTKALYEKLENEWEVRYLKQKKKERKESAEKLFPDQEDDPSLETITEDYLRDLQYRIKTTENNDFLNGFLDFCASRSLHFEMKKIIDNQFRILKKVVNHYLREEA
jgi:hypothetical protein